MVIGLILAGLFGSNVFWIAQSNKQCLQNKTKECRILEKISGKKYQEKK